MDTFAPHDEKEFKECNNDYEQDDGSTASYTVDECAELRRSKHGA